MPFTLSHPALVLPLNYLPKKWYSVTALVVGSMMPDLEAFLRFKSEKNVSHTWDALFWFCLPLGLLICYLFHQYFKNALIHHLPSFLQTRFIKYTHYNWTTYFKKNIVVVLLSLLMGGASHLAWDSFTHYNGIMLQLNPEWDRNTNLFGYSIEIIYVIQYANTLLGFGIILFAIWQLPKDKSFTQHTNGWRFWLLVLLVGAPIFVIRWLLMENFKIDDVIVSGMTALALGIVIVSLIFYKQYRYPEPFPKKQQATKGF